MCVASTSKKFMESVARIVENKLAPFFPYGGVEIIQKKITSTINNGKFLLIQIRSQMGSKFCLDFLKGFPVIVRVFFIILTF